MLQVWSVDEDEVNYFEHAMLQNMMKMLKNLSMNYLKQMGGGTEVDLLDYQELPLIPTREELVNFSNNPVQVYTTFFYSRDFFISLLQSFQKHLFLKNYSERNTKVWRFFTNDNLITNLLVLTIWSLS